MKAAENPFRSSAVAEIRYRIHAGCLPQLVDQVMDGSFHRCCLMGPEGSGKTTLMEDMEPPLRGKGLRTYWVRLRRESPLRERLAALRELRLLGPGDICLLDGGEVLPWWQWYQLLRLSKKRHFRLIATLHRKRGLPVLHQHQTDWPVTRELVQTLAGKHFSDDLVTLAHEAFSASHGNVREVFRACYWALALDSV